MAFSHLFSSAAVATSAVSLTLLLGGPAQAETLRLADNHMGEGRTDATEQSGETMMDEGMTIVEVASNDESFDTLVQALQAADLAGTLSQAGPYTVFAPTGEAFDQLPDGALEFLLQPENQDLLAQVLSYHVVPGEITASEITPGGISALSGGLAIGVSDSGIVVNNASVVTPDLQASNGVIHVINRVLIPEALQQRLAARLGVEEIY